MYNRSFGYLLLTMN